MKKILITFSLLIIVTACKKEETSKLLTETISDNNIKTSKPSINNNDPVFKSIMPEVAQGEALSPASGEEQFINTGIYQDAEGFYHLQYVLEVGKVYTYNSRNLGKETISLGGESVSQKQESIEPLSIKVLDFSNGKYKLEVIQGGKKETFTDPKGKKVVLDTNGKQPEDPDMKKMWKLNRALNHSTFTMDMDVNGFISNIQGLDAVRSRAQKMLSTEFTGEELKNIIKSMEQALNPEVFKAVFESSMPKFPAKGLKEGEKWNNIPEMKGKGYNQLGKVGPTTTEIKIVGYVKPQSQKETDKNGVIHTLSLKGTQQGTMIIDNKTGWVVKGNFSLTTTTTETAKKGEESKSITRKVENYNYINQ